MPYSGINDEMLPEKVKGLTDEQKAVWVEAFNTAYQLCEANEGTECDKAGMIAGYTALENLVKTDNEAVGDASEDELDQAVEETPAEEVPAEEQPAEDGEEPAEEEAMGLLTKILAKILAALQSLTTPKQQTRAVVLPMIYEKLYQLIEQEDMMALLNDVFFDKGNLFAICTAKGKIYKIPVTVDDADTVSMGEWEEIALETQSRGRTTITRTSDGKYRWFSISGSSVLNRSGEIDSRKLFDCFAAMAEKTGQWPIRVFYHAGETFRVGQVDFIARDGNLLITSGIYDNSELAHREIIARKKNPDYWGDSIGFTSFAEPKIFRAGKVAVPVYEIGMMTEVSTVPENYAAAWFTATPTVKEVTRMLNAKQMEEFIRLFDGDEAAAKKWLEENSATRNRVIAETGMVTRDIGSEVAGVEVVTEKPPVQLNDELIEQIIQRAATVAVEKATEMVTRELGSLSTISETIASLDSRLSKLEGTSGSLDTLETAVQDLSVAVQQMRSRSSLAPTIEKTVRPSKDRPTTVVQRQAEDVLAAIPVKY